MARWVIEARFAPGRWRALLTVPSRQHGEELLGILAAELRSKGFRAIVQGHVVCLDGEPRYRLEEVGAAQNHVRPQSTGKTGGQGHPHAPGLLVSLPTTAQRRRI